MYIFRFHAYSIANEYEDSFDSFTKSMEVDSTSPPKGRGRGDGMPSLRLGVGVREDVITLWEELDEARNTLAEIQALLCEIKDPKETPGRTKFYHNTEFLVQRQAKSIPFFLLHLSFSPHDLG